MPRLPLLLSTAALVVALLALVLAGAAWLGQRDAAEQAELAALQNEVQAVRREVRALARDGGEGQQAPDRPEVSVAGRPTLGEADAPVVMVEFTDYQCPYCSRFHHMAFPKLKASYIETGRVQYVLMDFPLSIHEQASLAAQAAHCAGDGGRYWEAHAYLFADLAGLDEARIRGMGAELGLDEGAYEACLSGGEHEETLRASFEQGVKIGVRGTPTFLIGTREGDTVQGSLLVGAQPYEAFARRIDAVLAGEG